MTTLTDETISALRANHDRLAAEVAGLSEDQLTAPSGASEWSVADVLSHLGSGAEIGRHTLAAALDPDHEAPSNQDVWDRWNALSPTEQASGFVEADEASVAALEALTPEQREELRVDLGFLPQAVSVATVAGMRLNEQALHAWDVEVGLDPAAELDATSADLLARHFTETLSFLLGFVGKPEGIGPVRVAMSGYTLAVDDSIGFERGTDAATATFEGPFPAALRLMSGRLRPERTPDGVSVTGDVTLEELRTVFPGY